ncbi:hypothetical protein L6164_018270 [Bauhinia variegata]|uniref:Uncharacterized protein n=1 Tax=Bauhinia variegata TaxID=167791 RepID=A0ACB9NAP0_BAUVA|nr:hypothetical protein L6164_018270 [Bauhinia variegata]
MSGRNRGPPLPMKGAPHAGLPPPIHEPPFVGRGLAPVPHPALLEEIRESQFGLGPRLLPPHPAILEERLAAQHQEIQAMLVDNKGLAATHVALKQELEVAQHELQRMAHFAESLRAEKDVQMRELYDKSVKLEVELRGVEAMRAELVQVRNDIKELTVVRQDLMSQVQGMTQDLARMTGDLQQVPALRAEIEAMKQELQRARAAIEYEKKGYAVNYEHGQVMEKKLISMARELEKLRAEIANTEKRAHAAAAIGNPGPGYNANYSNADAGYAGNPYPANYGMNPFGNPAAYFQPVKRNVSIAISCGNKTLHITVAAYDLSIPAPFHLSKIVYSLAWRIFLIMDLDLVLGVHMTCSELKDTDRFVSPARLSYNWYVPIGGQLHGAAYSISHYEENGYQGLPGTKPSNGGSKFEKFNGDE